MRKKKLILLIVIILVLIGASFIYWQYKIKNIQKKVLSSLEKDLEFCEIIKDDINILSNKGEFWLICNNRPFYVNYESGNVNYELNGWGFLKEDANLWNELKDCDFYDSKKIDDSYNLTFYCPKDFNSDKLVAKVYQFNLKSLQIKKLKDKNFLEILESDIKSIYSFMSNCNLLNFNFCGRKQPPNLWLNFDCDGLSYTVLSNLATVPLQPPILLSNLSYEKRAEISFKNSFGYEIINVSECYECQKIPNGGIVVISSLYDSMEISAYYGFMDVPKSAGCWDAGLTINFKVKCHKNSIDACVAKFIKYFALPPLIEIKDLKLVRKELIPQIQDYNLIYRVNNRIVLVPMRNDTIRAFLWESEGLYNERL